MVLVPKFAFPRNVRSDLVDVGIPSMKEKREAEISEKQQKIKGVLVGAWTKRGSLQANSWG